MTRRPSENGSALFFVLVAVMLFAALSYTVAGMMRGGDPEMISEERAKLFAGEILDQGRKIKAAVQDMRISSNCADTEISFENPLGYANGTNTACQVFHNDGGGLSYIAPQEDWLDSGSAALRGEIYFPANLCAEGIGNGAAGCESDGEDNEDLVMIIPYLNRVVCEQINAALGLPATVPVETDNAWLATNDQFTGSFADGEILDQDGRTAGCFAGSGTNSPAAGTYHFFQVLLPR